MLHSILHTDMLVLNIEILPTIYHCLNLAVITLVSFVFVTSTLCSSNGCLFLYLDSDR